MEGQSQGNPQRKLTPEEIQQVLAELRGTAEEIFQMLKADDPDQYKEYEHQQDMDDEHKEEFALDNIFEAKDYYGSQEIEELADFWNIDEEVVRTMPVMDAAILASGFKGDVQFRFSNMAYAEKLGRTEFEFEQGFDDVSNRSRTKMEHPEIDFGDIRKTEENKDSL